MTSPDSPATVAARIAARKTPIAVFGQGYVGLSLAAAAADGGFQVQGIDVNASRVETLTRGELAVAGVDPALFQAGIRSGRLTFSETLPAADEARVMVICVPTPLRDGAPDLSYVEAAVRSAAAGMRRGSLVVLESTTYPGTTDDLVRPILEEGSGLRAGVDFLLAFSPERIDPGNTEFGMRNTPRVVGGTTPEATEAAVAFYSQLVDKVVPVSSARVAETAKLLENTFRHVNIALVNELTMLAHDMGIDVWEVIDAAATKPFGFMPFYPGPGIGGHCIPLDPMYLSWQAHRETGRRFDVLEQAQDVNENMPAYVVTRVAEILNAAGRSVKDSRILVLGVSYKQDVGDIRESPALQTMQALYNHGADVRFHDFYVDEVPLSSGIAHGVTDLDAEVGAADVVLLLTAHRAYDLDAIADRARVVFDTRNAWGQERRSNVILL